MANNAQQVEYWVDDSSGSGSGASYMPSHVDLRKSQCFPYPAVKDQGREGACVAYAMSAAYTCAQRRSNINVVDSHLLKEDAVYRSAKLQHGNSGNYSGSNHNDDGGITFSQAMEPIKQHAAWRRVGIDHRNFKKYIVSGYPVVIGFALTDNMRDWQNDNSRVQLTQYVLPVPRFTDAPKSKYFHSVLLVGYNDTKNVFIARNSWGEEWGDSGHFYFPYQLVKSQVLDAMVVDVK